MGNIKVSNETKQKTVNRVISIFLVLLFLSLSIRLFGWTWLEIQTTDGRFFRFLEIIYGNIIGLIIIDLIIYLISVMLFYLTLENKRKYLLICFISCFFMFIPKILYTLGILNLHIGVAFELITISIIILCFKICIFKGTTFLIITNVIFPLLLNFARSIGKLTVTDAGIVGRVFFLDYHILCVLFVLYVRRYYGLRWITMVSLIAKSIKSSIQNVFKNHNIRLASKKKQKNKNSRSITIDDERDTIGFYIFVAIIYLIIISGIFTGAYFANRIIETIIFMLSFFAFRNIFGNTYHCKTVSRCIVTSVLLFWIAMCFMIPLHVSMFWCVLLALLFDFILFIIAEVIKPSIYRMTKDELVIYAQEKGIKNETILDTLIMRIIDKMGWREIEIHRGYSEGAIRYHKEIIRNKIDKNI